jgi:RNA polymerase sigma-70 factor, ECF subfamily
MRVDIVEATKIPGAPTLRPGIYRKSQGPTQRGVQIHVPGKAVDFDSIYHSYQRRVYALCLRMTRNQADAEDLTQEAFLRLFRKIATFRGDSAFTTWLHRLVVNVVLARLRKKSPLECSIDSDNRLEGEVSPSQKPLGGLDTTLISAIDRLTLELAVDELPVGFKTVFVLHDVEGYEHHEIAELLGVSEGTSKSQLHRARGRLRDLLKRGPIRKPHAGIARLTSNGQDPSGARRRWEGMEYR